LIVETKIRRGRLRAALSVSKSGTFPERYGLFAFSIRLAFGASIGVGFGDRTMAEAWKSDSDKRSGDSRRSGADRRSGVDTRSEDEKRATGERRKGDRRTGIDRRAQQAAGTK
jgi:hypothetical protein